MVILTCRTDYIALEEPETFKLKLESNSVSLQDGVFCINELDLVILDSDGKNMYDSVIILFLTIQKCTVNEIKVAYACHSSKCALRSEI